MSQNVPHRPFLPSPDNWPPQPQQLKARSRFIQFYSSDRSRPACSGFFTVILFTEDKIPHDDSEYFPLFLECALHLPVMMPTHEHPNALGTRSVVIRLPMAWGKEGLLVQNIELELSGYKPVTRRVISDRITYCDCSVCRMEINDQLAELGHGSPTIEVLMHGWQYLIDNETDRTETMEQYLLRQQEIRRN